MRCLTTFKILALAFLAFLIGNNHTTQAAPIWFESLEDYNYVKRVKNFIIFAFLQPLIIYLLLIKSLIKYNNNNKIGPESTTS